MVDAGEMAVRLGSPVLYDRRGETLWYDTFEHGLSFIHTNLSGAGSEAAIVADHAWKSGYSLKLTAGTTLSKYAIAEWVLGTFSNERMGAEFGIALATEPDHVQLIVDRTYNGNLYEARLLLDFASDEIKIYDDALVLHTVGSFGSIVTTSVAVYPFKLVADFSTGKYERILFADQEITGLNQYSMYTETSTIPLLSTALSVWGKAAANSIMYVSHFILTGNEP
jgi:hypothetical protein